MNLGDRFPRLFVPQHRPDLLPRAPELLAAVLVTIELGTLEIPRLYKLQALALAHAFASLPFSFSIPAPISSSRPRARVTWSMKS